MATPVGIASYGLYDTTDGYSTYSIETDKIVAKTTINALQANVEQPQPNTQSYENYIKMRNANSQCRSGPEYQPSKNDMDSGANLQFNVMMQVKTSTGSQKIWLQDTARFNTQSMTVNAPHDIVANLTTPNSENLAYGDGNPANKNGGEYYEYEGSCYKYPLPLTIVYQIDVQKLSNNLVQVLFKFNRKIFDTVYLPIPNVESAHIVVKPNQHNIPYDAELVWTGYCCSQESYFTKMDSILSMYYEGNDTKLHKFPSLFTFGTETAETATNLAVENDPHGGHVIIGQNNNSFLEEIRNQSSTQNNTTAIPSWIKNNAEWWSQGQLGDDDFVKGIQYLVQQGIIQIPQTQASSNSGSQQIPQWVKNTAGWWAEGQVSDDEFIKAVQYLVSSGIIQVNS